MLRLTMMFTLATLGLLVVQTAGQDLISPEQAKEAVRAFEGDPNLQFKTVKLETFEEEEIPPGLPPGFPLPYWYELEAQDRRRWDVDARTGEVDYAYYPDAYPGFRSEEPLGPLTKEDCRQIAENFARSKYAGFDDMNFELRWEYWTGEGWDFEWRQKLEYGAWGVNNVMMEVSPIDGRIQVYRSGRVEQKPVRQPKITAEQAIEIAKQALRLATLYGSETNLCASPDGSVYWEVVIGGELASGDYKGGIVSVNAETGDVLDILYEAGEFSQNLRNEKKWQIGIVMLVALLIGIAILLIFTHRSLIRGGERH